MKGTEICNYILPSWALPAIVNGDESGLEEGEGEKIANFIEAEGILSVSPQGEEFFSHTNDLDNMGSTCYDCDVLRLTFAGKVAKDCGLEIIED